MERKNVLLSNYPYPTRFSVCGLFHNIDSSLVDKRSGIEVGFNANITSYLDFESLSHLEWYLNQVIRFDIIKNRGLIGLSKDGKFFLDFGCFPDNFFEKLRLHRIDFMGWSIGDRVGIPALIMLETLGYYDDDLMLEHLY
jgi:hypothetical protein